MLVADIAGRRYSLRRILPWSIAWTCGWPPPAPDEGTCVTAWGRMVFVLMPMEDIDATRLEGDEISSRGVLSTTACHVDGLKSEFRLKFEWWR